jgi:hypothetical protein
VRRLLPALVAGLLVLAGLAALGLGLAMRTVWLPDNKITSTARVTGEAPVTITEIGVLEMRDGPVLVTTRSQGASPVLLAVGREADVLAWVNGAAHSRLTGLTNETTFAVESGDGEPTVPDPAGSDLWVQRSSGPGSATLTYVGREGRWLLLAASDGTAPAPAEIAMTWTRDVSRSGSTLLIAVGVTALLAATGLLGYQWWAGAPRSARHRQGADPSQPAADEEVQA